MTVQSLLNPPTCRRMAERYMHERAPKIKAKTRSEYERLWATRILPEFDDTRVSRVGRNTVSDWHLRIADSGGPFAANRALNLFAHGFERAQVWGWLASGQNPCRHVERFPEPPRTTYCSIEDVHAVGSALRELRDEQAITPESDHAIRACILTGCRRSEVLRLSWQRGVENALGWVDLERGALRYSDSKTGPKTVELSEVAWAFFSALRARGDADAVWCFRGHRAGSPLAGLQTAWERTRERAGLPYVQLRDLRRTFATALRDAGADLETIAQLLGHVDTRTTRIYALLTTKRQRELISPAAARLAEALLG